MEVIIMAKTDKELTVEIVNSVVTSWNSREGAALLQPTDVSEFIKSIYNTISTLPTNN
jgi:hypothetical protein